MMIPIFFILVCQFCCPKTFIYIIEFFNSNEYFQNYYSFSQSKSCLNFDTRLGYVDFISACFVYYLFKIPNSSLTPLNVVSLDFLGSWRCVICANVFVILLIPRTSLMSTSASEGLLLSTDLPFPRFLDYLIFCGCFFFSQLFKRKLVFDNFLLTMHSCLRVL